MDTLAIVPRNPKHPRWTPQDKNFAPWGRSHSEVREWVDRGWSVRIVKSEYYRPGLNHLAVVLYIHSESDSNLCRLSAQILFGALTQYIPQIKGDKIQTWPWLSCCTVTPARVLEPGDFLLELINTNFEHGILSSLCTKIVRSVWHLYVWI